MSSISDLKRGKAILFRDEPYIVLDLQHIKQGRGGAYMKTKMRNLKNGNILEYTFKSGEKIENADVAHKRIQYTYSDEQFFYFMDEHYEQVQLEADIVGDDAPYLIEGMDVDGIFLDDQVIGLQLPVKVNLKVTQAPPGIKGDTASGGTKQVTLETGMVVNVPLFIKEGDTVRINTETGQYVERV